MNSKKEILIKNLSNVPGWRTNRKILVIESDDWGSTRNFDSESRRYLIEKGLDLEYKHFDRSDCLESDEDLELLFDLLLSIKDSNNQPAKITPMCIMGNPDFDAIVNSDFSTYKFQPLHQTLNDYPRSSQIINLWKKGEELGVFIPEFHGREHVNVNRYMKILNTHEGKEGLRLAATHKSLGASFYKNYTYPNYLGALHPSEKFEIDEMKNYILEAGPLFERYVGRKPNVFVAPNAEEPIELEGSLKQIGVKTITRTKIRKYPLGDGKFAREFCFVGGNSSQNQLFLNRNAFFEPARDNPENWIQRTLKEIEIAFRWKKPALISSHRANFVGSIHLSNREKGLKALKELLLTVKKKWPEIEFMSSSQLGDVIRAEP